MELEPVLTKYVSDTFDYIRTVKGFVDVSVTWESDRQAEINEIIRIKQDETDDSDEKDLADLTKVLETVRDGVRNMSNFLDAMEKLSVTSVHVFKDDNPGFNLTGCNDLGSICHIIKKAQILAPVIILFKRYNDHYFVPRLENIEVLLNQLQKYKEIIKQICEAWRESPLMEQGLNQPAVEIKNDLSEEEMGKIVTHMDTLDQVRMNEHFRILCLFQGKEETFMKEFEKRQPEMRKFLQEIESCADQLDSMCRGANISGVTSSSLSIAGGILSILGLLFAPFTAGASLGLLTAGTVIAVSGGVTGIATSTTAIGVNETQAQKAKENFEQFVQNSTEIQKCLDEVIEKHFKEVQSQMDIQEVHESSKTKSAQMGIPGIRFTMKLLSIPGLYKNIQAFAATGHLATQAVGQGLSFIGKIGKELSKMSGTLNVFFLGVDIYNVVYFSKKVHAGCETQTSKWIRARVALWFLEIDLWNKIYHDLLKAQENSESLKNLLKNPIQI